MKTTVRCHLLPAIMAIVKKTINNNVGKLWRNKKQKSLHTVWGYELVIGTAILENITYKAFFL